MNMEHLEIFMLTEVTHTIIKIHTHHRLNGSCPTQLVLQRQVLKKSAKVLEHYTYLILTSQYGARHGILGNGAEAIVAQRLFHDNLEDVINKTVSLQDDVSRYQDSLKYARSRLDYSVGESLYMLPSNMLLKPLNQVMEGYNEAPPPAVCVMA